MKSILFLDICVFETELVNRLMNGIIEMNLIWSVIATTPIVAMSKTVAWTAVVLPVLTGVGRYLYTI